jgi:hypothetical protein
MSRADDVSAGVIEALAKNSLLMRAATLVVEQGMGAREALIRAREEDEAFALALIDAIMDHEINPARPLRAAIDMVCERVYERARSRG